MIAAKHSSQMFKFFNLSILLFQTLKSNNLSKLLDFPSFKISKIVDKLHI
jgi:hypothetical protein